MAGSITFDGKTCVDPVSLRRDCDERGIPVAQWWGKANGFYCPLEATPGHGWLLMRTEDVPADLSRYYPLTFDDGIRPAVTLARIFAVRSWVVVPSDEDNPHTVTLLELADAREKYTTAVTNGTGQMPDDGGRDSYTTYTWAQLFGTVVSTYGKSAAAVTAASLPFTPHGNPEGFDYRGWNQRDAIDHLLRRIGCGFKLNPITHALSVVRLGDTDTAADAAVAGMTAAARLLWDTASESSNKLPSVVRVQFDKSPAEFDRTEPKSSDGNPAYVGPDPSGPSDGFGGGVLSIADDLFAQRPSSGTTFLNATALDDRANERIADFVRIKNGFELHKRKVWEGWHTGAATALGSQWGRASWYDFGDGPRTELLCEPGNRIENWRPARTHPPMVQTVWQVTAGGAGVSSGVTRLTAVLQLPTSRGNSFQLQGMFRFAVDGGALTTAVESVTFGLYETNSTGTTVGTVVWADKLPVNYRQASLHYGYPFQVMILPDSGNTDKYYALFATVSDTNITLTAASQSWIIAHAVRARGPSTYPGTGNANTNITETRKVTDPSVFGSTLRSALLWYNDTTHVWELLNPPTTDDTYKLRATVVGGIAYLSWLSDP